MSDYTELIHDLRYCADRDRPDCSICGYESADKCKDRIKLDAAAAIEALLSFAHYVAYKVTMSDEDWEEYHEAFTEIACRKLVKLGVISVEDDRYVYRRNEPPQGDA